jgi:AcrR family transcriptional regulator/DNA-binding MarR family transcriptional regulator
MASRGPAPSRKAAPAGRRVEPDHGNGFERERVTDIQRARMLAAMTEVACERGAANVTVAHVVARSGVSRRTFYEIFEDREECFMAAFEEALARAGEYVLPAYAAPGRWRERMRGALDALLRFLDEEPFHGRLLVVETLAAGSAALQRRQQVLARLFAAVEEGRSESKLDTHSPLTAEGVVGAVLAIVYSRMLEPDRPSLRKLANQLMATIVLPYLGPAGARAELRRPLPPAGASGTPVRSSDLLTELHMRLTYRTVRTLMAIGASPASSNRQIADAAGISDPGQISKLLARLYQLGLIDKTRPARARGEPNAWRLTARGEQVERQIAARAVRSFSA